MDKLWTFFKEQDWVSAGQREDIPVPTSDMVPLGCYKVLGAGKRVILKARVFSRRAKEKED